MQYMFYSFALIIFSCQLGFAQIPTLGEIPNSHRSDWETNGVTLNNPPTAQHVLYVEEVLEQNPSFNLKEALDHCVNYPRSSTESVLVIFGNRTYSCGPVSGFDGPYVVGANNVIFQGSGSSTVISNALDVGYEVFSTFVIKGDGYDTSISDKDLFIATDKKGKTFQLMNTQGLLPDQWVHIHIENFHKHPDVSGSTDPDDIAWAQIGQISQIESIDHGSNTITIYDEANLTYQASYGYWDGVEVKTVVKKIDMVEGVGFENFKIEKLNSRFASQGEAGHHFEFDWASNCWVRGIESVKPARHHVRLNRSARVEVSGCYFNDGLFHGGGGGGYAYGVELLNSTSKCLVENNIFQRLRHSVLFQGGASGNVVSFNYSRDGYWPGSHVGDDPREVVFHGTYAFSNLVEHNRIRKSGTDRHLGMDGPFNAFVRNRIESSNDLVVGRASLVVEEDVTEISLLGNVIHRDTKYASYPPSSSYVEVDLYGYDDDDGSPRDHLNQNLNVYDDYELDDISYAYNSQPLFASGFTWPTLGPKTGTEVPENSIPASERFHAGGDLTVNLDLTPSTASTITIANSFGGGTVTVDSDVDIDSPAQYEWVVGSLHTIQASDQHWPATNNFFRRFENWIDPFGVPISGGSSHTFSALGINGTYTANFETLLDVDLDIDILYGGTGGGIELNGTSIVLPYSSQDYFNEFVTLEALEFSDMVNGVPVEYQLGYWSDASTANPYTLETESHIDLVAVMKGKHVSDTENATLGNSGKKIASNPVNGDLHLVYMDNGGIYYSYSTNGGLTWSKDTYIDGSSSGYVCQNPSISVDGLGNVHIVYEREFDDGSLKEYTVQYVWIDNNNESSINRSELSAGANNHGGYQYSTIPTVHARYNGAVYFVWRRSYNNVGTIDGELVVKLKDAVGNWSSFQYIPNTNLNCISPTLSYGSLHSSGNRFLHLFWVDTQVDAVFYINPDAQWDWGTATNLTLNATNISNFKNISVHQNIGGYPDELYLVCDAIEEGQGQSRMQMQAKKSNPNLGLQQSVGTCPPVSSDFPVLYFIEHDGTQWTGESIFRVNNTCDRKPVVTSWIKTAKRWRMIAFEQSQGKIATIIKNANWTSPTQVTNDGTNPSLTNPNDAEPNMLYTRFVNTPHEIVFDDNLLPPPSSPVEEDPELLELPHSRLARFRVENVLLGGALGIEGDIVFEMSDPEFVIDQQFFTVAPRYGDSLITVESMFEFNDISIGNSDSVFLDIPVSLKATDLTYTSGGDTSSVPFLDINLYDASTHQIIDTVYSYSSALLDGNPSLTVLDTIYVDLSSISSHAIYLKGVLHLDETTWRLNAAEVYDLTAVEDDSIEEASVVVESSGLPTQFALYQNYPNPFNPSTTIEFDLPRDTKVKIKIYDILGRLVKVLVDERLEAGTHQKRWDGTSEAGYQVSGGIYFYRMQSSSFTKVKKMLLIR